MINYPIKFAPILKDKIWGGTKLKELFNKETDGDSVGESWEISNVPGDISVVSNGALKGSNLTDLISSYKGDLVGGKIFESFGEKFPLLIKFIDAKENLSIQLHPNDTLAKERHNSFGKTEMWYVMDADSDSKLNVGFTKELNKETYVEALNSGKILEVLNFEEVKKGDSFFIKEGLVHAIGAGCMIAEIQQTSDITYRIYDWDRVDDQGNSRELHTELALDAIDYKFNKDFKCSYETIPNESANIASCEYFTTNYLKIKGQVEKNYAELDSFVIYMCVEGEATIIVSGNSETIKKGETLLVPAKEKEVSLKAIEAEILEVYIK
ncbi:type I phosphomannose isomerase catalytic subunit [Wenyingzhuangia sp. 2_MG-2023]|uniref:type I phosphomannose isomerase catalytic subunit n=1 Tax=Wenyingzhuangia sp. 2_MG-2023 TaxID=3062639 RepID=UPI0026E2D385|nr:type I phosphomannose isomerase catalytic subunit [Wenyingzhuangia sp. 2_MG-2023]MDO6739304.1 mannose-6-phosphate isomerase [Wenyingzhuangia sp. 2_MG-2023]MDO6802769.1 mannose-6-phosphate isomerase [Wenyingzhuangia sp. 1_MG-2023]